MQITGIALYIITAVLFAAYTIAPERVSKACFALAFMLLFLLSIV